MLPSAPFESRRRAGRPSKSIPVEGSGRVEIFSYLGARYRVVTIQQRTYLVASDVIRGAFYSWAVRQAMMRLASPSHRVRSWLLGWKRWEELLSRRGLEQLLRCPSLRREQNTEYRSFLTGLLDLLD